MKGAVFCIGCGRRLILQHTRGRNGTLYVYFLCHRRDNACPQRKALPVAQVEERIADCHRTISLTPEQRDKLSASRSPDCVGNRPQVRGDWINSMRKPPRSRPTAASCSTPTTPTPSDAICSSANSTGKAEFARNSRDRKAAEADLADLEQQTRDALDLLQDAYETYEQATEPTRKQLNRAIFTRVLLGYEPEQLRVELNEPYNALNEASD